MVFFSSLSDRSLISDSAVVSSSAMDSYSIGNLFLQFCLWITFPRTIFVFQISQGTCLFSIEDIQIQCDLLCNVTTVFNFCLLCC